jgi:hypothetical protein
VGAAAVDADLPVDDGEELLARLALVREHSPGRDVDLLGVHRELVEVARPQAGEERHLREHCLLLIHRPSLAGVGTRARQHTAADRPSSSLPTCRPGRPRVR